MKQIFKSIAYIAIATSSVVLSSCDPKADEPQVITGESAWKTDQQALASVGAAYSPHQRLSSSFSFLLESQTESTISFEGADDKDGPLVSLFKTDVNNWYPTKIFNYLYVSIGEANRTIEKADSSHVGDNLSKETIDLVRARAKFIRGYSYLYLVQLWGEVPLILSTKATATDKTTRRSIDDVYTQIVKDFTEAEAALPSFDQIRSNPSKGAANSFLAKAYLNWASKPLTQAQVAAIATTKADPAATVWDAAKLQKAAEYANKVINSSNYDLESNFEKIWGVPAENRSVEHIFTIHHDGDGLGDAQGNHQTHCPFTFRFDLSQDNHIGPADVNLLKTFSNDDKRKRFSILDSLYNEDEPLIASPKKESDYKEYKYVYPVTSPRIGKWIHRNSKYPQVAGSTQAAQPNNINRIDVRFAEILLIKAEALFYLDKKTEAATEINKLRTRAGLSTYTTLTQAQLEKEWELELYFEQENWLNLTRWHKLVNTVLTVVPTYEYYKADYKDVDSQAAKFGAASSTTNYPFFAKIYKHLHSKTDNVAGKFYRFPIPKGLSGNDLGIAQNPGY